ncbi:P4 alpha zinc-binding domain protein [gut metagenome]|uniref:p4 alpha zinc-binding domain protein n=1 Tax=gut metagenome TaxID=749906 RepID=J9G5R9_9ZZZZ
MAAHLLFKIPVWSAISAGGFSHFNKLPDQVQKLIIFGDNDKSFTGQAAAWGLAKTMRCHYPDVQIEVRIPPQLGDDWHDVFCRGNEESSKRK